jgi:hypothetical protein
MSTRVTRAPSRSIASALQPPNAPAPITATCIVSPDFNFSVTYTITVAHFTIRAVPAKFTPTALQVTTASCQLEVASWKLQVAMSQLAQALRENR